MWEEAKPWCHPQEARLVTQCPLREGLFPASGKGFAWNHPHLFSLPGEVFAYVCMLL